MKKIIVALSIVTLVAIGANAIAEDGATLFAASCAGCHGNDGSKQAGGSLAVKGQPAEELVKKLEGYAAGTYGGEKKSVMEKVAKKITPEEIKLLADYMSKL